MQGEVEEGNKGTEVVEATGDFGAAHEVEEDHGPFGVVELEGHAGDDEEEEAGDDEEVEEAFEGDEAGEPFVVGLGFHACFAELLTIVEEDPG